MIILKKSQSLELEIRSILRDQLAELLHFTDEEMEAQTIGHSHGAGVGLKTPFYLPLSSPYF